MAGLTYDSIKKDHKLWTSYVAHLRAGKYGPALKFVEDPPKKFEDPNLYHQYLSPQAKTDLNLPGEITRAIKKDLTPLFTGAAKLFKQRIDTIERLKREKKKLEEDKRKIESELKRSSIDSVDRDEKESDLKGIDRRAGEVEERIFTHQKTVDELSEKIENKKKAKVREFMELVYSNRSNTIKKTELQKFEAQLDGSASPTVLPKIQKSKLQKCGFRGLDNRKQLDLLNEMLDCLKNSKENKAMPIFKKIVKGEPSGSPLKGMKFIDLVAELKKEKVLSF